MKKFFLSFSLVASYSAFVLLNKNPGDLGTVAVLPPPKSDQVNEGDTGGPLPPNSWNGSNTTVVLLSDLTQGITALNDVPTSTPPTTPTSTATVPALKKKTVAVVAPPVKPTVAVPPAKLPAAVAPPPPPPPPPVKRGLYKDGVYDGISADAYYGNVQVEATVTNGKISNVVFLDYPQDRSYSIRVNTMAMPILKSEAIQAQSANVDIVSGASATSGAFQQSLASALVQAKA